MNILSSFEQFHGDIRRNKWMRFFTTFLRIALAYAFLMAGLTKVIGERFTSLSNNHPMGHYLEALYHTGFYYTFIGVAQMLAGLLLLVPRTALLGAILYFPIILNICILSYAVRFEGSVLTTPLMVLANLYLICWDFHRWKYVLPHRPTTIKAAFPEIYSQTNRFPLKFLTVILVTLVIVVGLVFTMSQKANMPRNSFPECLTQCPDSSNPETCKSFCECIHENGNSLENCLEAYGTKFSK